MPFETMDEYIDSFPAEVQKVLERIRKTIRKAVPDAVEAISYQIPTFKLDDRNLIHFAAYKNHIGFYPAPAATRHSSRLFCRRPLGTILLRRTRDASPCRATRSRMAPSGVVAALR